MVTVLKCMKNRSMLDFSEFLLAVWLGGANLKRDRDHYMCKLSLFHGDPTLHQ